ncbi:MAG TPA: penicillin acylase family protein [Planctomycetaceae bacterium]|jgi:penicillin amidase
MRLSSAERLSRLGSGESIAAVCSAAGISRDEFQIWWRQETASRVPPATGNHHASVSSPVRIQRDERGIPHVSAENDDDLFFGFGYATAQDRLFQLDYLRRRALGQLAAVLGPEGFELDLVARTIGLHLIAEREWELLPEEARRLVAAYSAGINALIADSADKLPIEFDLLDYKPAPWRPQDCLAIAGEFRWYLTGRFPVIVIPELAKRVLGTGALYEAFLQAEADDEAILPPGSYPSTRVGTQPVGVSINDPAEGHGSNNWVVSGAKSDSGLPMVASDPHIAFAAVSCWHEVHLCGGSFNVVGMAYAGMPAVMFGRNEQVAWGITNNLCSLRDLYQERSDPAHPGCFLFDGQWEPARERVEVIDIKGHEAVRQSIRLSRNGPIVDGILPAAARSTGPVSLKWQGASYCGWIPALLNMDRARSADELRKATEPWRVPTFCVVYADVSGQVGYQCTGQIPIRSVWERGYRPGWDPAHQWAGLIPFEGMPHVANPPRGWIGTANNRVAADDFPYPLSGTWSNGYRALRVRQMLEEKPRFHRDDFARMHQDSLSLRAMECVPRLVRFLESLVGTQSGPPFDLENYTGSRSLASEKIPLLREAIPWTRAIIEHLTNWDCRMEPDQIAASIFNVFFNHWCARVADERFMGEDAELVAGAIGGLAVDLLEQDRAGWFENEGDRRNAIAYSFFGALAYLMDKLGGDMADWQWDRLHSLEQKHFLSGRGDLGELLDRGRVPVRGDYVTVCNTGLGPDYLAPTGAGYRLIADLADPHAGLWAVDAGSESGHPGSPHYDDQLGDWLNTRYHYLPLTSGNEQGFEKPTLTLRPRD